MHQLMSPADRRAAHRAWLEGFGFSAEDWRRIRLLASEVTPYASPAALQDLSVPIRVGATPAATRSRMSGQLLGVVGDVALLYWRMGGREAQAWRVRRRPAPPPPGR